MTLFIRRYLLSEGHKMLENSLLAGIPGTGTFLRYIPGKNGIVGSHE